LYAQLWIHFLYAQYSNSHGLFTSRLDIFIDPRARKIQASTGNYVHRDTRMIEDNSPQQTNVLQSIKHTKAPYQVTVTNTGLKIICTKWVEAVPSEAREVYASQASCYPISVSADRSVSHNSILSVMVTAPFAFSKVCSFEC